jgi:uncharacterized protein (DUF1501 family)
MSCRQFFRPRTRRELLQFSACGFGQLALTAMAAQYASGGEVESERSSGLGSKLPHFAPQARRIIFLFMWGGPSHVDLFDPKPQLAAESGKPLSPQAVGSDRPQLGTLLGSPFKFRQHGQSGIWISELMPRLAQQSDRLCVVRSLHTEGMAHGEALLRLHTGQANLVRPSVGAWISYGLGSESDSLPAFITISPPRGHGGVQNYGNAFLPAVHQGMAIGSAEVPISKAVVPNLVNPNRDPSTQRQQLDAIQKLNSVHQRDAAGDSRLEALIASYELAFRMQSTLPQMMSLSDESRATLEAYGVGTEPTDNFARQCIMARKFAERGVRYIQVSTNYTWDHHQKENEGHVAEAAKVDQPIAALLADLDQRGLLDDTLVLWGGEFGRTPMAENSDGRGHHPQVFTVWMAGGGVRAGLTYGSSDEYGYRPVENPVHMHDLHATLLHLLGLDHQRLTFRHAGRDFRLTDVYGRVVHDLIA